MADNTLTLTLTGKKELEEKLKHLVDVEKPQADADLNAARALGDLSENADYDVAKERFNHINSEIERIRYTLDHAIIVDESAADKTTVSVGSGKITAKRVDNGKVYTFSIVGTQEADPLNGKISNNSPVALALIGHKVGDIVEINAPIKYQLEIVSLGE